eukprot:6933314-Prymnesium_polylepis.1
MVIKTAATAPVRRRATPTPRARLPGPWVGLLGVDGRSAVSTLAVFAGLGGCLTGRGGGEVGSGAGRADFTG